MVVGTQCPSISGLTWIKGEPTAIPSQTGEVLVLEFWATWCPPCKATIPHLTKLQKKFQDKKVRIIGISTDEDAAKAQQFVQGMGTNMDYTVCLDTGRSAYQLMTNAGAHGIPHAFVVSRAGKITYSGHPGDPKFEAALEQAAEDTEASTKEPVALPLVSETYEDLMTMSAKDLKFMLVERGISVKDCLEKTDFARKIVDTCSKVTYYK